MGTAMLVVEQNARLALEFAESAYILSGGRISVSGTAAEVATSSAVQDSYLGTDQSQERAKEQSA